MSFSIIIPFHNAERTICRCVESIVRQNVPDVQIILVNDHSNDSTVHICKKYLTQYENIMLVDAEGTGVSAARNTGLKYAINEIVGFCDADDFFADNVFNRVAKEFMNSQIEVIIAGYYYTIMNKDDKQQIRAIHLKKKQIISIKKAAKLILLDDRVMGSVWNKFYRKNTVSGICFDESLSYCEDMHFNCEVLKRLSIEHKNMCIEVLTYPVYYYVFNFDSVTNSSKTMFDIHDNLQYITALNRIESIQCISNIIIRYKKFFLAMSVLLSQNSISKIQKMKLFEVIRKNHIYFVLCFMLFPKKNLKLLIRFIVSKIELSISI